MHSATTALLLLLAVALTGFAGRMLRGIPLPLVQIAWGAMMTWGLGGAPPLDPEFFLFFFIPPLLFADARRYPKHELIRLRRPIMAMALNLVLWSVVGAGFFIDWLVPSIPLQVAFALAAVLSPTDPVAVGAITSATPVPRTMMLLLEGEALLNDATGLVCLRFAVAAMVTGHFSYTEAAGSFVLVALGGVAVGASLSVAIGMVQRALVKRGGEDPGTQVLVTLLQPFAAYLAAEHLHVSGILAAVAAGIALTFVERSHDGLAETRVSGNAVWGMLQFALNGAIFVLLGQQIPAIWASTQAVLAESSFDSVWGLIGSVFAITTTMTALRFVFVWIGGRALVRAAQKRGEPAIHPDFRNLLAMSIAGVRGAITLVGVLTLPYALADGSPFPARSTAIWLACGVILLSLVSASILLPVLLRDTKITVLNDGSEEKIRSRLADAAARTLEAAPHDGNSGVSSEVFYEVADRLVSSFRLAHRATLIELDEKALERTRQMALAERELRLIALRAARGELLRARRKRELTEELTAKLMRELDLHEVQLSHHNAH